MSLSSSSAVGARISQEVVVAVDTQLHNNSKDDAASLKPMASQENPTFSSHLTTSPSALLPAASKHVPNSTISSILHRIFNAHIDSDYTITNFATSPHLTPTQLAWTRLLLAIYMMGTTPAQFFNQFDLSYTVQKTYGFYFAYFTNLCWIGLWVNLLINAIHGFIYVKNGYDLSSMNAKRWKVFKWIHWWLYQCNANYAFIVTLVYWSLLSSSLFNPLRIGPLFINLNVHLLNSVIFTLEFSLNCIPIYASQWPGPILTAFGYLAYTYLFRHVVQDVVSQWPERYPEGFYAYEFLNTTRLSGVIQLCVTIVVFIGVWFGMCWLHAVRDRRRVRRGVCAKLRDNESGDVRGGVFVEEVSGLEEGEVMEKEKEREMRKEREVSAATLAV
ncbi:hypothetical protein HDV05_006617 [Chytridiales sp. JEL 0842]|nr:hypothetical protein HDV05_006617 [Chytridiales sp. JEL 0842]